MVLVDGRMSANPNTRGPKLFTKQDGTAGSSFEITASTVRFLSSRGETQEGGPVAGGMEMAELPPEDDIPF